MIYRIADIPVELPEPLLARPFARDLAPFAAPDSCEVPRLTLRTEGADLQPQPDYRELDRFDFADADADCRFGSDADGYLLEITPRDGSAPARFRKRFDRAEATTDYTTAHDPALLRFGLWTLYNLTAVRER